MAADEIRIVVQRGGGIRFIYDDRLRGLLQHGQAKTQRASHVEPADDGTWYADLAPVNGPKLEGFKTRGKALQAEHDWLTSHNIPAPEMP